MTSWQMARLGVFIDPIAAERRWKYGFNVFTKYITEILTHAGIPWAPISTIRQLRTDSFDIIIVACTLEDKQWADAAIDFVAQGGTLIAYSGVPELAATLGASPQTAGTIGYAHLSEHTGAKLRPLRFTTAQPWLVAETAPHRQSGRLTLVKPGGELLGSAMQEFSIGAGSIHRWAVDIPATIVAFQQGIGPVLSDGTNAPDGSAAVRDGILKADDCMALDWEWDRLTTETGQPYFAHPYADLWREVLLAHLLRTALEHGLTLPFLDPWPDGIMQVAMISHDSDLNIDASAETTLRLLKEQDVRSSWCMIEPGFSPYIYERVKADGHELAFHYNAVHSDNGFWDEAEFKRQFRWCEEALHVPHVVSNKNHYTRFEGWGELFAWCEQVGIQADQTRGPSKKGNVGFLFGTCHPYFPISWGNEQNRIYNVLEIGFLTQDLDLGVWADSSVIIPFLEQVSRVRGVAHFLFHQYHFHTNEDKVGKAFAQVVQEARQRGYVFWTGAEINDWVRYRRSLTLSGFNASGVSILEDGLTNGDINESDVIRSPINNAPNQGRPVIWVPIPANWKSPEATEIKIIYGIPCAKYSQSGIAPKTSEGVDLP